MLLIWMVGLNFFWFVGYSVVARNGTYGPFFCSFLLYLYIHAYRQAEEEGNRLFRLTPPENPNPPSLFMLSELPTEHTHRTLTRLFGHRPRLACYALAITIFTLGLFRDFLYERALRHQPPHPLFHIPLLAYALLLLGNVLVFSSIYALGLTGTYLGDYFGILMDEPVTAFPFNLTGAPMYYGSSMSFLGTALLYGRPAGVVLSGLVWGVYRLALGFEE